MSRWVEIIVRDDAKETLHICSSMEDLQETLEQLFYPKPKFSPICMTAAKQEPEHIRRFRLGFKRRRMQLNLEHQIDLDELQIEEEYAVQQAIKAESKGDL